MELLTITRLLLVRHGATTATEEGRFSGANGAELSDEGRRQATRLGEEVGRHAALFPRPPRFCARYSSSGCALM